ncbi:fused isobutyryl-CoA mutase/GTPase IcmF [Kineosporia sp. NBRC 101731]|uniref:fused isobutyryl-CoA mutase/GTPase IcmF n=1 Tax=Kineosporia sp. NBRC 101731 TaxID=3032199 RepID=UPI0024A29FE5|nr:fused isobutyryl-CoA mutase/GTPase IcmF [Kineosporia sp. NBRC 101731]GLY27365.1 Fused isobutyryl-CoA mutase [Kineosporia sp. NBRC 101731]
MSVPDGDSNGLRTTPSSDHAAHQGTIHGSDHGTVPDSTVERRPVRFVTAASLFDGHDASINIMRRILQAQGCEVIHLGHDRSVDAVVAAAIQEDVHGIAISSYQGGHVEYFGYLVDLLAERGAPQVRVFGGGGGVIVPDEIALLKAKGVLIFSPDDGQRLGLAGMISSVVQASDRDLTSTAPDLDELRAGSDPALARAISVIEAGNADAAWLAALRESAGPAPVLGITGTGGSGKSSLTDELIRRLRTDQQDKLRVAVIAVDPTRRRGGGALLGDRIRMNALQPGRTFFRSLATRGAGGQVPEHLPDVINACRAAGYDLVIVETPGIGQGDTGIVDLADVSLYVMTPEFGAASQLEKIDMLDFADAVAINKFERRGALDALRDASKQVARNREAFGVPWDRMPVFGTSAAQFNDDGVTALYQHLRGLLAARGLPVAEGVLPEVTARTSTQAAAVVPPERVRYLAEIVETVRNYRRETAEVAEAARKAQHLRTAISELQSSVIMQNLPGEVLHDHEHSVLAAKADAFERSVPTDVRHQLTEWPDTVRQYAGEEFAVEVRGRTQSTKLRRLTLSGNQIPRVALPRTTDHGDLVRYLREENLPGVFPFTAGVFRFKRDAESPARMFAGEGDARRTNRRFHLLAQGQPATRLSTAFDSVTLYGRDPDLRPDIYGKVGTSGVSIATLDDMRQLYEGFDLCDPTTSVSMTINGPAPAILAMFLNAAIDQQLAAHPHEDPAAVRQRVLSSVRGTVQADILKEDQGQNTCIFSTEFSLRAMADVQEWFIAHGVRNFYSVSISGYHIAEAGANPISQLAFTLANGFTYVESYLARGMAIDDFAPNLSFFFSNGMDAEYTVLGRVARRIWAVAMRERYGAGERSQKLKYHVQTSGRSLHAQEMNFNDIRTTLQALCALYDNANSLHTNAYDEAVTTPTEASVRRALAIQLIINAEWGLSMNENPLQGSYIVTELTDLVEEAVLAEFERISERGGVLGAMETGYQRGRIQDESMLYEQRKHDGSLPLIGVNTFLGPDEAASQGLQGLIRATEQEKQSQLDRLHRFHEAHRHEAPAALAALKHSAAAGGNVFDELMNAVRCCSLGQITEAFFEVGGQYRRNV